MPRFTRSNEEVEEELDGEMREWNSTRTNSVKAVRILCRPEVLWKKERGSLLVTFESRLEYEEAIQDGIFVFGERCKTVPYRPRHSRSLSPRQEPQDSFSEE
jgi:hypothetical protein